MRSALVLATLACLLAAAPAAEAIYLVTPLRATADPAAADVGDTVNVTLAPEPENATARADWAGARVKVYAAYDTGDPSAGPDAPTSDAAWKRVLVLDALELSDEATARFAWTVPAEADDRNVQILVETAEGELLAQATIGVGDAPPVLMAATGGAEPAPVETPVETEDAQDRAARTVPGAAPLAALALAALAALASRRRA